MAAIQLVLVARLLTPSDFGVMAASAAIVLAFVTISELGLESSLVSKPQIEQEDLAVVWTLAMGRGAAMALCLWVSADLIGQAMHMAQLPEVLRVHAWALVLQGLHSPGMAILLKNLDFKRRVTLDLVRRAIEAGVTISLAFWFRNVWALLAGQLVGLCVSSLLSFRAAPFTPRLSLHRPSLNYVLRYGAHLNVTALCIFGVMSGGELVIGRILGQETLGLYQIALAIPLLIGVRATALMHQLSMPTYALLQHDRPGLARVFELHMGLAGLVFIPPAVGVAVLAPVIVPLAFGTQWLSIIDPLRILCLYAVCAGLSSVMTALHYGVNRVDLQMKSWVMQFLVYAAVIVPLIGYAGIAGAAAALAACYLVGLSLQWIGTRALIGTTADGTLWSIVRAGGVAALLTGSLVLVVDTGIVPTMSWLVLAVCTGALGWYCWHVWSGRGSTAQSALGASLREADRDRISRKSFVEPPISELGRGGGPALFAGGGRDPKRAATGVDSRSRGQLLRLNHLSASACCRSRLCHGKRAAIARDADCGARAGVTVSGGGLRVCGVYGHA